MREQKTAIAHYYAKDFFGSWATAAKLVFTDNYLCVKTTTDLTSAKTWCTKLHTGGVLTAGYAYITAAVALHGNALHGILACAQSKESCGVANKYNTFASATAAKTSADLKVADDKVACSFVIAATCDTPYAQVDGASYEDATYTDLVFSVAEHQDISSSQWTDDTRKFLTAVTDCTKLTLDNLKTVVKEDYTAYKVNAGTKIQGTITPTVQLFQWKSDGAPAEAFGHLLLTAWTAKQAEVKAFNTAKSAYETLRDTYNTKLAAAEKLQKDEIDKDMFRKLTPTEADKKVLNAVPARPSNPTVPAAYSGPTAEKTSGDKAANTVVIKAGESALVGLNTETLAGKDLVPGKSFGLHGWGNMDNTAVDKSKNDGTSLGKAFSLMRTDKDGKCVPNYMLLQVGVADKGKTNAKTQKIHFGVKEALYAFDAITIPAAATDPKTPTTGAQMLAAGAASIAVAMTLF
jgi:hypothetical protein